MKVYADQTLNVLIIEGVSQGPVLDFSFSFEGDLISAYRIGGQYYDFKGIPYYQILDSYGRSLPSLEFAMGYLNSLTIPTFPLRFTTEYPLRLDRDVVSIDDQFINQYIFLVDGGNA